MIVFFVSLFLDWAGAEGFGFNGTEFNSWWVAVVLAAVAAVIFAGDALNVPVPMSWASLGAGALAALLVFVWALTHFLDATEGPGGPQGGAWIGLIASAAGAAIAAAVWSQERA